VRNIYIILSFSLLTSFYASGQGYSFSDLDNSRITLIESAIASLDEDHCEVPCGIYGDSLRILLIEEHAATVEKAMLKINEISASDAPDYNQLVRWVMNKEKHAEEIQYIVSQYFMHQRVKMPKEGLGKKATKKAKTKYHGLLSSLHAIQVYAMKTKQTTDPANVGKLREALDDFSKWYFHGHKH